jgi:Zinc-binding dehydrogenase
MKAIVYRMFGSPDVLQLAEVGRPTAGRPIIDRTYPLAEAPAAMRHLERRHARGKVVITI